MGLDMFLFGKKYVSSINWEVERLEDGRFTPSQLYKDILTTAGVQDLATDDAGLEVQFSVGYWRKANAVHGWFVDRVQGGEDDCGEYPVTREKLQSLRDVCQQAIRTKDPQLLPPTSGFFFGSNEVDDWYWSKLEDTVEILNRVLSYPDDIRFYYQSSW